MIWKSVSGQYLRSLMMRFEAGPEQRLIDGVWVPWPRCPDGGALKAYPCSAGKWTIAFGVRWHPDGRPVVEGDEIAPDQVWEYTDAAIARVEADLSTVVTIEMNPHQFGGVVFWVYNLGITALKKTVDGESQLLPKINAGRWLDVASAMGVFVYTTTEKGGKAWKRAMFGLFIRRCAEGCTVMGCDWVDACDADRLSLPTRTDWQPALDRYYDVVLEGKTPFLNVYRDAKAHPLELILTNKAEPRPPTQAASAGQPAVPPQSPPQVVLPSTPKPAETVPSGPAVKAGPAAPNVPAKAQPVPSPAPRVEPPPKPPVIMPPSVQVNAQPDMGPTTRTMWVSKRFWGGVLIIGGRLIIAADVTGTFAPAVKAFIGDGILMDWGTGVIVTVLGEMIFHQGEKKAEGPMDTPKRIALMTPAP